DQAISLGAVRPLGSLIRGELASMLGRVETVVPDLCSKYSGRAERELDLVPTSRRQVFRCPGPSGHQIAANGCGLTTGDREEHANRDPQRYPSKTHCPP